MSNVKYFKMGRIYAKSREEALERLGTGVLSLKACLVQIKADRIWFEYMLEIREGCVDE